MAKKFGKILAVGAFIGAAVLGGIAYYIKSKDDSNSLDDDFDDFQDEFEDDEKEDLRDDFSSVDRGYVTIPKEHTDHMAEEIHSGTEADAQAAQTETDDPSSEQSGQEEKEDALEKEEESDEDDVLDEDGEEDDSRTPYSAEEI